MLYNQESTYTKLTNTILRFPIALFCALILTIMLVLHDYGIYLGNSSSLNKYLTYLSYGFFAFTALKLFVENHKINTKYHLLSILSIIAFTIYLFYTPNTSDPVLLQIGLIFLIPALPYTFNDIKSSDFCYFTIKIIIILFFSIFCGLLLSGGISIIIGMTSSYLFNINIPSNTYITILKISIFFFTPFYTLSEIPRNFTFKNEEYPKPILFFISNIVAPLIVAYFIILNIYAITIILKWDFPKEKIIYITTIGGFIGILTHLLLYRAKDNSNLIVKILIRYFYYSLITPTIILSVSIYKQIYSYGITQNRYTIAVSAIWLASSIIYYLFNKNPKFKVFPLILGCIFIVSSFGPHGNKSISI